MSSRKCLNEKQIAIDLNYEFQQIRDYRIMRKMGNRDVSEGCEWLNIRTVLIPKNRKIT